MRYPKPLPTTLSHRAFTGSQLREAGGSSRRHQRSDIVRLGSGIYAHVSLTDQAATTVLFELRARALLRTYPHAWLSHVSAAKVLRCPLPTRLQSDSSIHLSVEARRFSRPQRHGVTAYESTRPPNLWTPASGLASTRTSSPARVFLELAPLCSVPELVAIGDWLVRTPYYQLDRRDEAYTSLPSLQAAVDDAKGQRGVRQARQALELVRVGADSAKETAFRLAVINAGLPEPQLQVPLNPQFPQARCADAGYPQLKIAIQYDGATHFTADRARADQRRDNEFLAAGWLVLRLNVIDDRENFSSAVTQLRAMLRSQGWSPEAPSR